jgi:hypothetical protein
VTDSLTGANDSVALARRGSDKGQVTSLMSVYESLALVNDGVTRVIESMTLVNDAFARWSDKISDRRDTQRTRKREIAFSG